MLVDDLQYARLGYKLMLGEASDIAIVAQAGDGRQAIAEIERLESAGGPLPDVVLMDVRMPVMDGITATREITRRWPAIHVLILTTYDEDDYAYGGLMREPADSCSKTPVLQPSRMRFMRCERRRRGHATHHPADSRARHAQTHSRPRTTEAAGFVRSPAAAPTRDMHTDRGRHDQRGNRPQTGTGARDDTTNHQSKPLHLATA